jgi:hypothetical protein
VKKSIQWLMVTAAIVLGTRCLAQLQQAQQAEEEFENPYPRALVKGDEEPILPNEDFEWVSTGPSFKDKDNLKPWELASEKFLLYYKGVKVQSIPYLEQYNSKGEVFYLSYLPPSFLVLTDKWPTRTEIQTLLDTTQEFRGFTLAGKIDEWYPSEEGIIAVSYITVEEKEKFGTALLAVIP